MQSDVVPTRLLGVLDFRLLNKLRPGACRATPLDAEAPDASPTISVKDLFLATRDEARRWSAACNTAAGIPGKPLELSATSEGEFMDAADLGDKVMCRLAQVYNGTDDFAIVWWGAA